MAVTKTKCDDKAHAYLGRFKKPVHLDRGHNFSVAGLFKGLGAVGSGASDAIMAGNMLKDKKKKKLGQLFTLFK